jgi:hypothetical protein
MSTIESIVAYLSGDTSDAEATEFEVELFAGEHDGDDLTALAAMLVDVRHAAFLGMLTLTVSRAEVEALRAEGYRILEVRCEPDRLTEADLDGDFELLLVEFVVDLTDVVRLDAEVCDADGHAFKRVPEIPFQPGQTSIMGYCARETVLAAARALPEGTTTRFLAVDADGERVVGVFRTRATRVP